MTPTRALWRGLAAVIASAAATAGVLPPVVEAGATVGRRVQEGAPRPPLFPGSSAECQAYSAALDAFQRETGVRHQACLDGAPPTCPDDPATGCTCTACAEFHGGVSYDGVRACHAAVRETDERVQRVNQLLASLGVAESGLIARAGLGSALRGAAGDSQLARDLARVSVLAKSSVAIAGSLDALRGHVRSGEQAAARADALVVTRELAARGLRNPIALFMTDAALDYVSRVQGDALGALEEQLRSISSGRAGEVAFVSGADPAGPGCAVLADERASRDLMQRDPDTWLGLVQRCAPGR